MSIKPVIRRQYQRIVDTVASQTMPQTPSEGWLRTVRNALGMSGAQLAHKMGVSRARIAQAEQAERRGGVTLRSMHATAEAMGCRFVYAIVPPSRVEDLILAQARKQALAVVGTASQHMALESQTLPNSKIAQEVERLTQEIARDMPADFWRDE
jgi:predicted DNA-binding mobile mystery protein A